MIDLDRIEILDKGLTNFTGMAWLVKDKVTGQHYAVSGTNAFGLSWEVLVFRCTDKGEVTSWSDVAGRKGISHEEAIGELLANIEEGRVE